MADVSFRKACNNRVSEIPLPSHGADHDEHEQKAEQNIHCGSRKRNQNPFPYALITVGVLFILCGKVGFRGVCGLNVIQNRIDGILHHGFALFVPLRKLHAAFSEHADKASDGKRAKCIDRAALFRTVRNNARSHSDGEFQNLHAARPRDQKMSQFMNENEKTEDENCK